MARETPLPEPPVEGGPPAVPALAADEVLTPATEANEATEATGPASALVLPADTVKAAGEHRDELPEELDASSYVGMYTFPNNNRRRISGLVLAAGGLLCVAVFLVSGEGVLVNRGLFDGGLFLLALACYHFASGVTLRVDETDALVAATKTIGFTVGHASAQLSWRGLISHPMWRILLYSADDPPKKRALVLVDAVRGTVGDHFVEDNPEDWSSLDK
jgi:hypothetical protein